MSEFFRFFQYPVPILTLILRNQSHTGNPRIPFYCCTEHVQNMAPERVWQKTATLSLRVSEVGLVELSQTLSSFQTVEKDKKIMVNIILKFSVIISISIKIKI